MKKSLNISACLLTPIFVYWMFVLFFGMNRNWLLIGIPVVTLIFILTKIVIDNSKTIGLRVWVRYIPMSMLMYIPIALMIALPIAVTIYCENKIYEVGNGLYAECQDKLRNVLIEQERVVEKSRKDDISVWWKPWTYGSKVDVIYQETVKEMVTKPVIEKTAIWIKVVYGGAVSLLDFAVVCLRVMEVILILISFTYIHSQVIIGRSSVRMSL